MDTAEGWEWRPRAASFLEQECLGEAIPRGGPNYCPGFGPSAQQVTCALLPPPPDSQLHSRLSASPSATSLPQFLIPFQTRGTCSSKSSSPLHKSPVHDSQSQLISPRPQRPALLPRRGQRFLSKPVLRAKPRPCSSKVLILTHTQACLTSVPHFCA